MRCFLEMLQLSRTVTHAVSLIDTDTVIRNRYTLGEQPSTSCSDVDSSLEQSAASDESRQLALLQFRRETISSAYLPSFVSGLIGTR